MMGAISTRSARRHLRHWTSRSGVSVVQSAIAILALGVLAAPAGALVPVAPPSASSQAALSTTCNPKNPSPSAIDTPGTDIWRAAAGDILNVSYQYRVANYTAADHGVRLLFPSATTVFPVLPSGTLAVNLAARTVVVTNGHWTNVTVVPVSSRLKSTPTFNHNVSAYLSTSKIAVMATTPTGSMTIQVRWHWTLFHAATATTTTGGWTVPSLTAKSPFLPSIFFPAAYVGIVSTSGPSVPSNTTYVVDLNGTVSATWFRMVIEYPSNGTEIQSIIENTSAGAVTFNATVPAAYRNGTGIPAGKYLIHVHDSCQAIVHLLQVTVT